MGCGTSLLDPKDTTSIFQGESRTYVLEVEKDNPNYPELSDDSRIPEDITGATIIFTLKRTVADTDVLIRKTTASATEIDIVDGPGGVAHIFFAPEDTLLLPVGDYVYDVWIELSGARYNLIPPSTLHVVRAVTRF